MNGAIRFDLVYLNENEGSKRFESQRCYLPKGIIENFNITINGKNPFHQAIDSNIKRYKQIRKLTTREGEDYLLDIYYIMITWKIIID